MGVYPQGRQIWETPGLSEELTKLYNQGFSASQAAKAINKKFGTSFTRNAIIGRACRMNLQKGRPEKATPIERSIRKGGAAGLEMARASAARKRSEIREVKPASIAVSDSERWVRGGELKTAKVAPDRITLSAEPLAGSAPKPWLERRFGECCWPVGDADGADQLNCCLPVRGGKGRFAQQWCAEHHARGTRVAVVNAASSWDSAQRREHSARVRAGLARRRAA